MRRILTPVTGTWLALALALVLAPAALADGRDPRCDTWETSGAPAGINMTARCPPATGIVTADAGLENEPLVPYIVGLLVMAAVLTAFGFVAMRLTAKPSTRLTQTSSWWTCTSCNSPNQPGRTTCFACQVSRGDPAPTHPA